MSADFRRSGPGAIAIVDAAARARTQLIELPSLADCAIVAAVPGDAGRAAVLCSGPAFGDEEIRRASAGVVRLAVDDAGTVAVDARWIASEHPAEPSPTAGLVPLDARRLALVADQRGEMPPSSVDELVVLDLESAAATVLHESASSFVLGDGAFDPDTGLLLVPDAESRAILRFDVSSAEVALRDTVAIPTCRTLPPRQVRRVE
jgi:hypothetical protein